MREKGNKKERLKLREKKCRQKRAVERAKERKEAATPEIDLIA